MNNNKFSIPRFVMDIEKGLALAITKRALGNTGSYYNTIKKWIPEKPKDE